MIRSRRDRSGERTAPLPTLVAFAGLLALLVGLPRPASAQVRFGSPGGSARLAFAVGAFDMLPSARSDRRTSAEFRTEYRFGQRLGPLTPFLGAQVTTDGAFYGFGGFGLDIRVGRHFVVIPNTAAGYFEHGSGTDLGYWWEFRSGLELDYRFANRSQLGVTFHHMSNAGLGRHNPGEESLMLVYSVPIR